MIYHQTQLIKILKTWWPIVNTMTLMTYKKLNPNQTLSLFHLNACSLNKNFDDYNILLKSQIRHLMLQVSPESKVIWILQLTLICSTLPLNTHQQKKMLQEPSYILVITAYKPRKHLNIYKTHKLESTFIKVINSKNQI